MPIIPQLTPASGLDIFLRDVNGNLTDPSTITYDIIEPGLTVVANDTSGFRRSTGHYDARNTTIPSGFDLTLPWTITWTFIFNGVTTNASEEFTVAAGLSAGFILEEDLSQQIKTDLAISATEFTTSEINIFITKAVNRINRRLLLTGTSAQMSYNSTIGTISPALNSSLQDLIVLQTECLIAQSRNSNAVSKGIRVKDGDSEIDTTAGFAGHKDVISRLCDELDEAIKQYLYNTTGAAQNGKMVWYGNSNVFEEMGHNGQGNQETRDFSSPFDSNFGSVNRRSP